MLQPLSEADIMQGTADVLAVGPGLGDERDELVIKLTSSAPQPVVLDADGLNALARADAGAVLRAAPAARLLTPHPGEMARLQAHAGRGLSRRQQAEIFAESNPGCTLLLKGSRTVIATRGQATRFNSTGHPGMAGGGFGDVLTGLCAALLAQGMAAHDAAAMGSWLLGRTAEIVLAERLQSPESLLASDVASQLGLAFADLANGTAAC
jgi:NAD(P)H-hydrate epimerase